MATERDGGLQVEARRILERVSREADSGRSMVGRVAQRAVEHVSAADADADDWAEQWGTRIGRVLAIALVVAMIGWLVLFALRGL